jgi:dipeptidyl aminopeptidase/acylaminoacyl peptidase
MVFLALLLAGLAGHPDGSPAPVPGSVDRAPKRAFELEDVYRVAVVGAPACSPDGAWVAFTVRRNDVREGESWSNLWRMRADGSEQTQLTFGRHADGAPRFSPDGAKLAFVSTRSGAPQVWLLPLAGGEARQLTDWPLGVADPVWSPDGRWIAVSSELWPDAGADAAAQRAIADAREERKLEVHVADALLYRHWTDWKDGRTTHVLLVDAYSGAIARDLTPGPWDAPTFALGGGGGYAFTPDGRALVFNSNHDADQAGSTNVDLWRVEIPAEGSELAAPINLTAANRGWDGDPVFSPDGRWLAWTSQAQPGYESDLKRIALMEAGGGSVRYLTGRGGFDESAAGLRWSPRSDALYFTAERAARTPIFRAALDGSSPVELHRHGLIEGFDVTPDGARILFARRSITEPAEIAAVPANGGAEARLTRFNASYEAEIDLRGAQEMWIDCAAGDGDYSIHTFVIKPHGFEPGKRYPLILNVHGGPQSQWADAFRGDWQVYPGRGYAVAFCNPTGSTGYGQEFCDAIGGDWGGRVYRDLMRVTDELAELDFVDAERLGAMGWSYGGYMMMWFQGQTRRFRCQAAMMGIYDLDAFYGATEELWFPERDLGGRPWESDDYERFSPDRFVGAFETPALVITGELDFRCPYTQSLAYFTALQERGVPSELVVFPGAGHWPGPQEMLFYYASHLAWFERWLGGEPSGYDLQQWARLGRLPDAPVRGQSGSR